MSHPAELENQVFYYENVNADHFWSQARNRNLMVMLNDNGIQLDGKLGLEIGCGNCIVSNFLESRFSCTMDAVDLFKAQDTYAIRGQYANFDITLQGQDVHGKYDFVVLFDVLEHIEKPQEFLRAIAKFLKPEGILLLHVPSFEFLYSRYDKIAGHHRRYTSSVLQSHVGESEAFVLKDYFYWGLCFLPLVFLRKVLLNLKKNLSDRELYEMGFEPPTKWINTVLNWIAYFDTELRNDLLGTSLLAYLKKK